MKREFSCPSQSVGRRGNERAQLGLRLVARPTHHAGCRRLLLLQLFKTSHNFLLLFTLHSLIKGFVSSHLQEFHQSFPLDHNFELLMFDLIHNFNLNYY